MKKVVVLGGGTGMSNLLRGLKQYPLDITAIVTVCDDGKSTGILREEFNIPSEYIPVCLLPLGYKADDCPVNPMHEKRKNIEDIVEYK